MTCEARLQWPDGRPYTCSLPADLVQMSGALGSVHVRLCADCQQTFQKQDYIVIRLRKNEVEEPTVT